MLMNWVLLGIVTAVVAALIFVMLRQALCGHGLARVTGVNRINLPELMCDVTWECQKCSKRWSQMVVDLSHNQAVNYRYDQQLANQASCQAAHISFGNVNS